MSIKQLGKKFEFWVHRITWIMNLVSVVVLALMMLVQTIDVVSRYAFNAPLKVSMDMIELMMAILVFMSISYAASINSHIRVDLVIARLSKPVQENLDRIISLAGAFILALITWRLGFRAWGIIQNPPGPVTLTMLVPFWPFILVAAVGCFFYFLECLIRVFNPNSGKQEFPETNTVPLEKTEAKSLAR